MPDKTLKKAAGLFYRKKFHEVIKLLEPLVFQYRDNFLFYYYLGTSCLYINDLGGAFSYLNRALQLKKDNVDCLLGLAAVYLKRRETDKCLQIWLDILEWSPGQRRSLRGLNLLRKSQNPGELLENNRRLARIYPPVFSPFLLLKRVCLLFFIFLLTTISGFIGYLYLPSFMKIFSPRSDLPDMTISDESAWLGTSIIHMEKSADRNDLEGNTTLASAPFFTFNQAEIKKHFNSARDYFLHYRENRAQVEINRLLLSNASPEIKEKVRALQKYIKKPDFTSLKDTFSYQQISREPLLYQNCYVIWKGKLANLNIKKNVITFDFLINYHHQEELLGTVPVILNFAADIKNGDNLEILAKIILNNEQIVLEGVSIHKLMANPAQ